MTTKEKIIEGASLLREETGWRWGQSVFNYVDMTFNVARYVQLVNHIDCFYNDDAVDTFIDAALKRINETWKPKN